MSQQVVDYSKSIEDKLQGLDSPVVAVLINPIFYQDASAQLIKYFTARYEMGIYVSLNKPVQTLKNALQRQGVSVDKLRFIDSVTNTKEREEADCYFLGKIQELTNLALAMSRMVNSWKEGRHLAFDSLSTLLIYNDAKSVARFAHLVTEKLRGWGLSGALMVADMVEERTLMSHLAQFCDTVLTLGV